MRRSRLIIGGWLVAAALALAAADAAPAQAGQPEAGIDPSGALPGLPLPAESGKAAIGGPPVAPLEQNETLRCPPALPCGTRLYGTIRKNGAIELQVPALRW